MHLSCRQTAEIVIMVLPAVWVQPAPFADETNPSRGKNAMLSLACVDWKKCKFLVGSIMHYQCVKIEMMFEGSLEVKLPTIWTDGKAEVGRVREEEKRSEKKEDAGARKGRKVAIHCVFPMICGSGGSKSRLAKAAGAEPAGQMRDKKLHAVVARSTFRGQNVQNTPTANHFWKLRCQKKSAPLFQVKMHKTHQLRTTFGSWEVEKVHAVMARSTFPSQNVENTRGSEHFCKLWCRKVYAVARSTFRSQNAQNTTASDQFWKLRCRKRCTPLWREAHFRVKVVKSPHVRTTSGSWDVKKSARCCGAKIWKPKVSKTLGSEPFLTFRCRESAH